MRGGAGGEEGRRDTIFIYIFRSIFIYIYFYFSLGVRRSERCQEEEGGRTRKVKQTENKEIFHFHLRPHARFKKSDAEPGTERNCSERVCRRQACDLNTMSGCSVL